MNILWLGSLHSDNALKLRAAVDQAAVKWSRGLIRGLNKNGVTVTGLTHCYEPFWPKGEIFPGKQADFDTILEVLWIKYINVPLIKYKLLSALYGLHLKKIIRVKKIDCLLIYNTVHPYHVAALRVARKKNIPVFPIILDDKDPRKDCWRAFLGNIQGAKGVVFLSNWMFQNCPTKIPRLLMDGGYEQWYGDDALGNIDENLIVYSGGLDKWRGLSFLVEVIKNLKNQKYKIVICGKCDRNEIKALFNSDPRVDVKGFVSDEELHSISLRASLFLSTRDPNLYVNIINFPSKIINYLAYGKPVVSTWVPSFSEEYRNVLNIVEKQDPAFFAEKVEEVMGWDKMSKIEHYLKIKSWFISSRFWHLQGKRLLTWMQQQIEK